MQTTGHYLAVFMGSKTNDAMKAWNEMSEEQRKAKSKEGMDAWYAWAEKHKDSIVVHGGPLGKTKKVSASGVSDISNEMGGYTVVKAASFDEAAKMFEKHPHFTIFPGERVEIMPVMEIPKAC